ncbi:MAG: hypothetical protein L3J87_05630, partial [Thermoplasmata archaeon]|nr:hypothetical protein [Thermoplasmata archaeon]
VTATDADGVGARGSVELQVNPAPEITDFAASPSTLGFGSSTAFSVTAVGGTAPLSYAYTNLPTGCSTQNSSSLACTPSQAGSYLVQVTVADRFGVTAGATTNLSVTSSAGGKGPSPGGSSIGGLPWWVWALLIGAIVVAIGGIWYRFRKPSSPSEPAGTAPLPPREYVPPPDDVPGWTESSPPPETPSFEEPPP